MSDTLGTIRRALRSSQAAQRRALRHKMDRYNPLASKGKTPDNLYDMNSAKTTQDVIEETLSAGSNHDKRRRAPLSRDSTDRLLQECNVVSPEVREAWHARIGMVSLLSDANRLELRQQAGASGMKSLRDAKLSDLAKWMVYMWCEGEGYDPDKHQPRIK